MKDIFGTEIQAWDIIALGIRSGNVGDLALRVVIDPEMRKVVGRGGGIGTLGEGNKKFVKLTLGQLQNKLGYELLDLAFRLKGSK